MTKELQDLAWSVLPKEFKEEVKKIYNREIVKNDYEAGIITDTLAELFGIHNLTSDSEGEEMLTVSRKRVQEIYSYNEEILSHDPAHSGAILLKKKLTDLFGSKCLPDNVDSSDANVDSLHGNVDSSKPKPAEPKYHVEDKVIFKCSDGDVIQTIHSCKYKTGGWFYNFAEGGAFFDDGFFEPYTEPTETLTDDCQSQSKSQDCDRLQIAAMAMQGILGCEYALKTTIQTGIETMKRDGITYRAVAEASFLFADALIAESEKGGMDA